MNSKAEKGTGTAARTRDPQGRNSDRRPGWASGLRQMYDSVVDEELPDNFKRLLSKLDEKD